MPARSSHRRRSARTVLPVGTYARIDLDRERRVGVPEVILAEGKSVGHLLGILNELHRHGLGALVSRPTTVQRRALQRAADAGLPLKFLAGGRLARLSGPLRGERSRGPVAILAAGTSDVPVAEEARALLEELGIDVLTAYDVGVAGLHRLTRALGRIERHRPRAYLILAGREGALATIVAGLVRAPVVGLPTSVGYGRGARGEAALTSMLQSCAPLAVVNIDAAVPAALHIAQWLLLPAPPARTGRRRHRRASEGVL
jgi:NCAIR mutase (PurE)-related protein